MVLKQAFRRSSRHSQPSALSNVRTRTIALLTTTVLVSTFVSVLYRIVDVTGDVTHLLLVVGISLLTGTVAARVIRIRTAVLGSLVGLLGGVFVYLSTVAVVSLSVDELFALFIEALSLLTGVSLLQIINADVWTMTIGPVPVFLIWFLSLRHRYAASAWTDLLAVGFFTLTGDAGQLTTFVGTVSSLTLLAIDAIARSDVSWEQLADVGILVTSMLVLARFIDIVPDGTPLSQNRGLSSASDGTLEGSLMNAEARLAIQGSVSLSATARFTVSAETAAYWYAGTYDRYTGQGWVRTGPRSPYDGTLQSPPGDVSELEQQIEVESRVQTLPAAWRPTRLRSAPRVPVSVTESGTLQPARPLEAGDTYTVSSDRPRWTPRVLRETTSDYPETIRTRHLQLPRSTSDRLITRAREIVADSETAYGAARAIQNWLERSKSYSLDVDRPDGDVADSFVFEMDRGYCVYYATAMVVMLRAVGIPSRFAVGYTPGEQVGEGRWLVRGFDSHAWVDVYFSGVGWVQFDPTPAAPRREAERGRLDQARSEGEQNVDTDESGSSNREGVTDPTGTQTDQLPSETDPSPTFSEVPGRESEPSNLGTSTSTPGSAREGNGGQSIELPNLIDTDRDRVTLLAGVVGVVLGTYRLGLWAQFERRLRLSRQFPTDDPNTDVERAFERLELLLRSEWPPRKDSETPRSYLNSLDVHDERVFRVVEFQERVQYGPGVSRREADEAISLVDDLVDEPSTLFEEHRRR